MKGTPLGLWKVSVENPNLKLMMDLKASYVIALAFKVPPVRARRYWILTEREGKYGILANGDVRTPDPSYRADFQGPRSIPKDTNYYSIKGDWAFYTMQVTKTFGFGPVFPKRFTDTSGNKYQTTGENVKLTQDAYLKLFLDMQAPKGTLQYTYFYLNTKNLRPLLKSNPTLALIVSLFSTFAKFDITKDVVYEGLIFPSSLGGPRVYVTPIKN